ncbi:MAG: YCF48-related protein [Bacteroidia bacterium]
MQRVPLFLMIVSVLLIAGGCREKIIPTGTSIAPPATDRLTSVYFHDRETGFVAGGRRFDLNLIFRTDDGGTSWERQAPFDIFEKIVFNFAFDQNLRGFAVCYEGKVLRTTDGGQNWQIRQTEGWMPLRGVAIVDDSVVVVVGGNGYDKGIIHRSTDAGNTWAVIDTPGYELRDVVFTSPLTGYACGYGTIIKTTDGGKTWALTPAKNEFFSSITFPTPSTGIAVGRTGTIVRTTDSGENWEVIRNGSHPQNPRHYYNKVKFATPDIGFIVGDNGQILRTEDGGQHWKKVEKETHTHLHDIYLFSDSEAVVAGESGTLIHLNGL